MSENTLFSFRVDSVPRPRDVLAPSWLRTEERITIERDCLGRHLLDVKGAGWSHLTLVGSAWSEEELFFHFDCWSGSPSAGGQDTLVIVLQPESGGTSVKLEIDSEGGCVDAHVLRSGVDVDLKWRSGAEIEIGKDDRGRGWQLCLALPLEVLLRLWSEARPEAGAVWRLNLARIVELDEDTEYLLWRPGFTAYPDILNPAAFGNLMFLDTS